MGQVIKVRCNGPQRHVNEVDLAEALSRTPIARNAELFSSSTAPARIVMPCRVCAEGRVIVTREMIDDARGGRDD